MNMLFSLLVFYTVLHLSLFLGNVLECYDKDKLFPVYGFGGVPSGFDPDGDAFHCFPLNGNDKNPNVSTLPSVLLPRSMVLTECWMSTAVLFIILLYLDLLISMKF